MEFVVPRVVEATEQKTGPAQTPHLLMAAMIVLDPPIRGKAATRPRVVCNRLSFNDIDRSILQIFVNF